MCVCVCVCVCVNRFVWLVSRFCCDFCQAALAAGSALVEGVEVLIVPKHATRPPPGAGGPPRQPRSPAGDDDGFIPAGSKPAARRHVKAVGRRAPPAGAPKSA